MAAIVKIIIGIVGLIFSIFIITTIIPNQIHQQQVLNTEIQQTANQLDQANVKLVNDCMSFTSVGDLTGCKSSLTDLKNKCQSNPDYSSMSVCNDQSISQFLSTVDNKIAYAESVISNDSTKMVDLCVHLIASGGSNLECISDMQNIQQSCNQYNVDNHMAVCSDPRINEILSGSISSQLPNMTLPNFNQNQNASDVIQSANQYTLSFIDSCMKATDSTIIQTCSETAKKMLDYCNNISSAGIGQICNDPRLAQLANTSQTTNLTEPLNSSSQTTINATTLNYLNSQMQSVLNKCTNTEISNSASCINGINLVKQDCSNFGKSYPAYFPVCNDPRLQQASESVSSTSASTPQSANGFLKMDKSQYSANANPSEYATVSGKVNDPNGGYVTLTITYPYGGTNQLNAYVTSVGTFSTPIVLDQSFPRGTYVISGNYHNSDLGTVSFVVK